MMFWEAMNVAAFLSAIGAKAYKLVYNLVASNSPKDKVQWASRNAACALEAKTTCDCGLIQVYKRMQHEEESVAEYIVT